MTDPHKPDQGPSESVTTCSLPPSEAGVKWSWLFLIPFVVAGLFLYLLGPEDKPGEERLPRGDVAIDAGVAACLAEGRGFWTPWERGTCYRVAESQTESQSEPRTSPSAESPAESQPDSQNPEIETTKESKKFGHPADQHPPLWPLVGAGLIRLFDLSPLQAMEWGSFGAHLLVLALMIALGVRLKGGRWAVVPALAWALISVGSAFSFNASLYAGQAFFYLAAVLLMGRKKTSIAGDLLMGAVLAGAWLLNYQSLVLVPAFILTRLICQGMGFFRPGHLLGLVAGLAFAVLLVSPWLMRNAQVFGSATYSVNHWYLLSKVGATFSQSLVEGRWLIESDPLSPITMAKGLIRCAWFNIPYMLLLLLVLFPGCLAAINASAPCLKHALLSRERKPLFIALTVVIGLHLAASLAWPALKVRYLVPVGPLVVTWGGIWAWQQSTGVRRLSRKSILLGTFLIIIFGLAVWLKGSMNGKRLFDETLLSFFTYSFVAFLATCRLPVRAVPRHITAIGICALFFSAVLICPGGAYFNMPPVPDMFGQDKDRLDHEEGVELRRMHHQLSGLVANGVIGDMRLWHIDPALSVVTPPKKLAVEGYLEVLKAAAEPFAIRYAILESQVAQSLVEKDSARVMDRTSKWVLIDIFP